MGDWSKHMPRKRAFLEGRWGLRVVRRGGGWGRRGRAGARLRELGGRGAWRGKAGEGRRRKEGSPGLGEEGEGRLEREEWVEGRREEETYLVACGWGAVAGPCGVGGRGGSG